MSYILDALKRSEQEREAAPTAPSPLARSDQSQERDGGNRLLLPLLLLAVAVIVVLVLLLLRKPEPPQPASADTTGPATTESVAVTALDGASSQPPGPPSGNADKPVAPTRPQASQPTKQRQRAAASGTTKRNQPGTSDAPAKPERLADTDGRLLQEPERQRMREEMIALKRRLATGERAASEKKPAIASHTTRASATEQKSDDDGGRAPLAASLPVEIQSRLPRVVISVLAYSETPERRFVRLGGEKLYQGDKHSNGLRVEEITRDGVVFRFEETRFFHSAYRN